METAPGLVVVGASHAGVQLAASAREMGYAGPITLIGEEAAHPYQRPPLSKALLLGKAAPEELALRSPAFFAEARIALRLGRRVAAVDRAARAVVLQDGARLPYEWLALATGARARPLPGSFGPLPAGVLTLRNLEDALTLREAAAAARHVVVLGGGFIGLEAAAALAGPSRSVALVEARPRLLARSASAALAEHVAAHHRAAGIVLHLGAALDAIEETGGRVSAVRLTDGARLPADLLLVGIGVLPNQELAEAAGLPCADGIVVDQHGRTGDSRIVAAGDCTAHPCAFAGRQLRLESIQNAVDQARAAAATVAGRPEPHLALPWFWSDQLGMKLQMTGLLDDTDITVRRAPSADRCAYYHFAGDRLRAVETVSWPGEHLLARKLLASARQPGPSDVADAAFSPRQFIA